MFLITIEILFRYGVLGWFLSNGLGWWDERILRVAGVALAVLGAVLVSPHGFKRMLYLLGHWATSIRVRFQMWLSHYLKFVKRPSITAQADSIVGSGGVFSARGVQGINIPANADNEFKFRILEEALRGLQDRMEDDYAKNGMEFTRLGGLIGAVDQKTAELHAQMVKAQTDSAAIDAAGLLVIAWGIILSGIPQELAGYPVVGWTVLVLGAMLACAMTRKTIKDGAWSKKANEA